MARLPQPGGDSGRWGEILNDYLSQAHTDDGQLKSATVGTTQLQPNAVTTDAIADAQVTNAKIADGSISAEKIQNGAVGPHQIADGAIGQSQLLDRSVTTAKLDGVGEANGVASLDATGHVTPAQLPERLSDSALAAAHVRKAVGGTRFGSIPDGAPPSELTETRQPVTHFGNTPLFVTGGRLTFNPVSGSNRAGYEQVHTQDGRVAGVSVSLVATPGATSALAIVLPTLPWVDGSFPAAEVHAVLNANGSFGDSLWTGSTTAGFRVSQNVGAWDDGREHRFEIWIDYELSSVTYLFPSGRVLTLAPGSVDVSRITDLVIVELYAFSGVGAVPISILGYDVYTEQERIPFMSVTDVSRAISSGSQSPVFFQYAPSTDETFALPATAAHVPGVAATFKAPPSGVVAVTGEAFLEISTAGHILLGVNIDNNPVAGLQRVATSGTPRQRFAVTRRIAGLTPGTIYTVRLSALAASGGVGGIRMWAASGYTANLTVTPVAS